MSCLTAERLAFEVEFEGQGQRQGFFSFLLRNEGVKTKCGFQATFLDQECLVGNRISKRLIHGTFPRFARTHCIPYRYICPPLGWIDFAEITNKPGIIHNISKLWSIKICDKSWRDGTYVFLSIFVEKRDLFFLFHNQRWQDDSSKHMELLGIINTRLTKEAKNKSTNFSFTLWVRWSHKLLSWLGPTGECCFYPRPLFLMAWEMTSPWQVSHFLIDIQKDWSLWYWKH